MFFVGSPILSILMLKSNYVLTNDRPEVGICLTIDENLTKYYSNCFVGNNTAFLRLYCCRDEDYDRHKLNSDTYREYCCDIDTFAGQHRTRLHLILIMVCVSAGIGHKPLGRQLKITNWTQRQRIERSVIRHRA
ncbi:uncharacterized protein LOC128965358 [Oppia nitens]|uniref:uncharacterized protein LOC128965358 n=1 Tax=Oppia nitens TaxID=1686743 RepID=UPI0023DC019F|nr:uncharacterized protein LOC128965358 [Oppia nitens]